MRHGAGAIGQHGELAGDAGARERTHDLSGGRLHPGAAEDGREVNRVTVLDQPLRELDHPRMDPRNLGNHDDRRARAGLEDLTGQSVEGEVEVLEPGQGGAFSLRWHDGDPYTVRGARGQPVKGSAGFSGSAKTSLACAGVSTCV